MKPHGAAGSSHLLLALLAGCIIMVQLYLTVK